MTICRKLRVLPNSALAADSVPHMNAVAVTLDFALVLWSQFALGLV